MGFLKKSIIGQEKCSIFFNAIRKTRLVGIEKSREKHEWGPPEFKIYPSSLKPKMCPVELLKKSVKFNGIEDLTAIYRVSRGKALHWELQQDLLQSEKIWNKPICVENMSDRIIKKLQDNWPEVPFQCFKTGVSGSADGVIKWQGIVPVEIKSTSQPPEKWKTYVEENLPSAQHVFQIGSYMHFFNELGYWPDKAEKGILAYQNTLMAPGDQAAEVEFVIYLNKPHPVLEKMKLTRTVGEEIEDLINSIAQVREQFIKQYETYLQTGEIDLECTYSKCSKHGKLKPKT